MKKIITTLTLASIATGVFAQGQVAFANFTANITTNAAVSSFAPQWSLVAGSTSGKTGVAANGFYYTLLFDTAATPPANNNPNTAGWTQLAIGGVPVVGTNIAATVGDMQGPKGSGAMLVDNWAAGTAGNFIIVGWSANLGTTWSQVSAELASGWSGFTSGFNWFGVSAIDNGTPTASPSPAMAAWTINGGSFALNEVGTVPEPATMALAALGGASLLLFRRKK